jgi:hypothetical protein
MPYDLDYRLPIRAFNTVAVPMDAADVSPGLAAMKDSVASFLFNFFCVGDPRRA